METPKTKTNLATNVSWSQEIATQINESRDNLLWLIAFQHIREELEKFNDWNHIFIIHQTIEANANKIMQSPYFSNTWLVWTSLIANLDTIINACFFLEKWTSGPWFQLHKSSNSLVIMIINKKEFEKQNWDNPRNLNDIDDKLSDYIEWWEINRYWLPNRCVWWYINWVSYHKNHNFNWNIWQ